MTGGGAWAENRVSSPGRGSVSATGWTYTVGAGIEAFVAPRWSVKAEYLYAGTPDNVPTLPGFRVSGSTNANLIRVGANYHF